ncbi:YggN family protein [Thalassotalea atypica]|uniref:YggN family protein n=1 Tax=Thalassotalea atypica TaxID=2054316 RepID=UPI0025747BA7|nr:YggN family protein [Thalassotalea atypica]
MNKFSLLVCCSAFTITSAFAEHCNVNFNYGVVIDPTHVRILDHGQTYVQFNENNQVFVRGREIELTEAHQQTVSTFVSGIREQVPTIVSIAIEGVEIGLKAVNKVIGGLTGENSASHRKIQENFDEMQMRLRKRFNHSDESYYIAPQDFDEFDEIFTGEFEHEIEEIVSESIGTILVAVGEAMANRDEEDIEQRVDTFDERIQSMGTELKLEVGDRATQLEAKAEKFCLNLSQLDKVETEMQLTIPALSKFNLITTSTQEHQ